jgi:hypothetical protein
VLLRRQIVLLNPNLWEDSNDAYYLERYRREMRLRTVLAICFSERRETFHHWRIYASALSGVCIEFDKEDLLKSIARKPDFRSRRVRYLLVAENTEPELRTWPFLKRKQFEDEDEFRIIYESGTENLQFKRVRIDLSCIHKVTLSPWLPQPIAESVIDIINKIDGCSELTVNRSSLLDNSAWRKAID